MGALAQFKAALALRPGEPSFAYHAALMAKALGDGAGAAMLYRRALARARETNECSSTEWLQRMAQFDYTELLAEHGAAGDEGADGRGAVIGGAGGGIGGGRQEIDAVLAKHPHAKEMHATLGIALYLRSRDAEAIQHLTRLCDSKDYDPVADAVSGGEGIGARRTRPLPDAVAADVAFVGEMKRDLERSWGGSRRTAATASAASRIRK